LKALAWVVFVFCLVLAAGAVVITGLGGPGPLPAEFGYQNERVISLLLELSFPLVGALIVSHRPRNLVGWLLLLPPAILVLANAASIYAIQALVIDPGSVPFGAIASWTNGWIWVVTLPTLPILLLLYPSGTLLSPRWRWVAWSNVLVGVVVGIVGAVLTLPYRGRDLLVSIDNLSPELRWGSVLILSFLWFIVTSAGVALVSLVLRYRRGGREQRLQIKWLAVAVALLIADGILSLGFPIEEVWRSIVSDVVFALVPLAIGIAVLKYRLYEIEVIINRTLVYVPLVAIIGGLATAMIPLSQRVFMAVTGNESDAAIVLTTLFVASFITPVRKRLEAAVEGRFKSGGPSKVGHAGNGPGAGFLDGPEAAAQLRSLADRIDALERRPQSMPDREGP
jgi:hypothetical protein